MQHDALCIQRQSNRVLHETLPVILLVKKFLDSYGTRILITALTTDRANGHHAEADAPIWDSFQYYHIV